ncbi:MAG: ParA family protein [Caulobacteraceae bacterium]|nr:ParA family protein [Caulobacteraceae bacterium]
MPVITFASPKGGAGKTTSCLTLATQLAQAAAVTIVDADVNHPIAAWSKLPNKPEAITVVSDVTEANILDKIEDAAKRDTFVLVDLEGTASLTAALAISAADLVIIPLQASQLDANQAARAIGQVKQQERVTKRSIPMRILFTRSSAAIQTRTARALREELAENAVACFETQLLEREAFKAMFSFGGPLELLATNQVSNPAKAIDNARAYAAEVVAVLKEGA